MELVLTLFVLMFALAAVTLAVRQLGLRRMLGFGGGGKARGPAGRVLSAPPWALGINCGDDAAGPVRVRVGLVLAADRGRDRMPVFGDLRLVLHSKTPAASVVFRWVERLDRDGLPGPPVEEGLEVAHETMLTIQLVFESSESDVIGRLVAGSPWIGMVEGTSGTSATWRRVARFGFDVPADIGRRGWVNVPRR